VIVSEVKTGVFEKMSMAEYESIPALRWSRLSEYLRSAAHGKAAESRMEDSDDLTIGQAVHTAVLEPGAWEERFGVLPEDAPAKRSNADKLWWANFYAANQGRTFLKRETYETVRRCAEAVYAHPRANLWLTSPLSKREVVVVWMDREFGMFCKIRCDLVTSVEGLSRLVDLKSTRDASAYGFSRDVNQFHYAGQVAFYLRGLDAVAPFERSAAFIAVEKDPAIAVCYDLGPASLEIGQDEVRRAMTTFIEAEAAQKWPGYPDGVIELPAWRLKGGE
jgi:hypothetical protein